MLARLICALFCAQFAWAGGVPFDSVAPGLPGAGGVTPVLAGSGNGSPGSLATLALHDATPGSHVLLVIGLELFGGSFFGGGVLGPTPDAIVHLPLVDPGGALERRFRVPPSAPVGLEVLMQAWMRGGAPSVPYAASNTLRLTVAPPPGPLGTLLPSVTYDTGVHSEDVAVVDVDGDGYLDLLVLNRQVPFFSEEAADLVVMHGTASGDLESGQQLQLPGVGWGSVKVADLDGDGIPEVLVVSRETNSLGILAIARGGQLSLAAEFATGTTPFDVAVGDFDGDGVPDVVVANLGDRTLTLWRGLGAGVLEPAGVLDCTIPPRGVATADVDGDGVLDLVAVGQAAGMGPSNNGVNLFRGNGDLDFTAVETVDTGGNGATSVVIADLDDDGYLDLAVSNRVSDDVAVVLNNGAGGFLPPTLLPATNGPFDIAAADLDGDGHRDLVANNAFDSTLEFYWGEGDGTFLRAMSPVQVIPDSRGIALGDLDADGDLDVIVTGSLYSLGLSNVTVIRNRGQRVLSTSLSVQSEDLGPDLALGDLNQDGLPDLALLHLSAGEVEVRAGFGDGAFAETGSTFQVGALPNDIELADVDGDGLLDAVVTSPDDDTLSVLVGNGGGGFLPRTVVPSAGGPRALAILDADNDGDLDLAVTGFTSADVALHLGNGRGGFVAGDRHAVGAGPAGIAHDDLDGDGWQDLATANGFGNTVSLLFGTALGFQAATSLPGGFGPTDVEFGDVDGDGALDLVLAVSDGSGVVVYRGDGAGAFPAPPVFFPSLQAGLRLALADLDLDGRDDVIFLTRAVTFRQAIGPLLLGPERFTPAGDVAWQGVATGDVDLDGDIDVVALSLFDDRIAVIRNELFCADSDE